MADIKVVSPPPPPVARCKVKGCLGPMIKDTRFCTIHGPSKAKRQAILALESEVREFCLKVEELETQYGFSIVGDPEPFSSSVMVAVKNSKVKIDWLGDK